MYTVAVVTGTRAEYGLLRPVLQKLQAHNRLALQLIVTGAHLSPGFGHTIDEIEADGFSAAAKIDILAQPAPEGRAGTAVRAAAAQQSFTQHFLQNRPDVLLLLGDRYEALAAGTAAALLGIPVAHISGGDVTYGADDDWFRHCLTKLAKLHFPSCQEYRQRVVRMGEAPETVHNVGALGDENIRSLPLLSLKELNETLNFDLKPPYIVATLHPETATDAPPEAMAAELFAALNKFPDVFCLFTGANADAGGEAINTAVAAWCQTRPGAAFVPSLGVLRYLSAAKHAAAVVGNSSSGVVETPSLGVPAVDIGARQRGRLSAANVLHTPAQSAAIAAAIQTALQPSFAEMAARVKSPYNGGNTSQQIVDILFAALQSGAMQKPKEFYDGEVPPCNC